MQKVAAPLLVALFSLIMVFHLLILVGVIPYTITWGGRLKSDAEMYRFESFSLIINALLLYFSLAKAQWIRTPISPQALTIIFWAMAALFLLNTIGNIFALNTLEQQIFAPITLLISIGCIILARNK